MNMLGTQGVFCEMPYVLRHLCILAYRYYGVATKGSIFKRVKSLKGPIFKDIIPEVEAVLFLAGEYHASFLQS